MKQPNAPLAQGVYYHIYNRGNNRQPLFYDARNYTYFLSLYVKYIEPFVDTYAYCLLKNHFHFLIRIKTEEELSSNEQKISPSKVFSNLFNAYAKAINKSYNRTGSLFEENFGRIPVLDNTYLAMLIFYIHANPQKHGFLEDFRDWQWSSYNALISNAPTRLQRDQVLNFFGGKSGFEEFHRGMIDESQINPVLVEDAYP